MILLDGIITDFEETKRSIISASDLPMSIIIVGNKTTYLCVPILSASIYNSMQIVLKLLSNALVDSKVQQFWSFAW